MPLLLVYVRAASVVKMVMVVLVVVVPTGRAEVRMVWKMMRMVVVVVVGWLLSFPCGGSLAIAIFYHSF